MLRALDVTGYSKPSVWCGPAAIAILTGVPVRESTELLSRVTRRAYSDLEGTDSDEVIAALHQLGFRSIFGKDFAARYPDTPYGPTLGRFFRERSPIEKLTPLLVQTDTHWLTCHMGFASDSWTKRPVPVAEFPKPKRLVKAIWLIEKM